MQKSMNGKEVYCSLLFLINDLIELLKLGVFKILACKINVYSSISENNTKIKKSSNIEIAFLQRRIMINFANEK